MADFEARLIELRPKLQVIADQFEATDDEAEQRAIAKEGVDLLARAAIQHMLGKIVTPENLAAFGVQEFAKGCATP